MVDADATFRPDQREAIEAITTVGARVLVVQRTGWGKSLVYWLATRVLRDRGEGPTVIISPPGRKTRMASVRNATLS